MERSGRMASRYGELYRQLSRWVANGAIPPISPSTASAWRSLAVPTAWATCSSPVTTRRCWRCAIARTPSTSIPSMPCPTAAVAARAGPRSTGGAGQPGLELGYSKSLIDNFLMDVQGSGFVHYGDDDRLQYLGYSGKNGHGYVSIGRVLIDRGEVPKEQMSMKAIKEWANRQPEESVKELVEQNPPMSSSSAVPPMTWWGPPAFRSCPWRRWLPTRPCCPWAPHPRGSAAAGQSRQLDRQAPAAPADCAGCGGAVKKGHLDLYHGMGRRPVSRPVTISTLAGSGSWVCTTGRPPPPTGCNVRGSMAPHFPQETGHSHEKSRRSNPAAFCLRADLAIRAVSPFGYRA